MTLSEAIAEYILAQPTAVSKAQLYARAESKGHYTRAQVRDALTILHKRRKDIRVTVRGDDNWYDKRPAPRPIAPPSRIQYTPEQIAMSEDCFNNCPFYSDEEREAHRTPFKDRTDRQHEITDTPTGYDVTMERKYGVQKWQRMKQECAIV